MSDASKEGAEGPEGGGGAHFGGGWGGAHQAHREVGANEAHEGGGVGANEAHAQHVLLLVRGGGQIQRKTQTFIQKNCWGNYTEPPIAIKHQRRRRETSMRHHHHHQQSHSLQRKLAPLLCTHVWCPSCCYRKSQPVGRRHALQIQAPCTMASEPRVPKAVTRFFEGILRVTDFNSPMTLIPTPTLTPKPSQPPFPPPGTPLHYVFSPTLEGELSLHHPTNTVASPSQKKNNAANPCCPHQKLRWPTSNWAHIAFRDKTHLRQFLLTWQTMLTYSLHKNLTIRQQYQHHLTSDHSPDFGTISHPTTHEAQCFHVCVRVCMCVFVWV